MNWFQDSRLKAHVMYASPDWAPDRGSKFDPDRLTELLASAGVTALELYCKDIHGYSYYPTEFGIGEPYPRDVLGELLASCRRTEIKFIAYQSIGWDRAAGEAHPDWLMRTRDGGSRRGHPGPASAAVHLHQHGIPPVRPGQDRRAGESLRHRWVLHRHLHGQHPDRLLLPGLRGAVRCPIRPSDPDRTRRPGRRHRDPRVRPPATWRSIARSGPSSTTSDPGSS